MAFEFILAIGFVLFLFGFFLSEFYRKMTKAALGFTILSFFVIGWSLVSFVGVAANPNVAYYTVVTTVEDNGQESNVIKVTDDDGQDVVVDLRAAGLQVPKDGAYRVARTRYPRRFLGIDFGNSVRYHIEPQP